MRINLIRENKPGSEGSNKTGKKESKKKKKLTPAEEISDFVSEFKLEDALPPAFATLNEAQKLKVVQDLKQRVVDIVKSDAQTQYSEDLKGKKMFASLRATINKNLNIKNLATKIFAEFKDSEEGKQLVVENLTQLTEMARGREVIIGADGRPNILYINPDEVEDGFWEEKEMVNTFNAAANAFRALPYEWGQEKERGVGMDGKKIIGWGHKNAYEKTKAEYERARDMLLDTRAGREMDTNKRQEIVTGVLQLDNTIQLDQLLNTHPEFEKELSRLSQSSKTAALLVQLKDVYNTVTGGNVTAFAGGFGARMLASGAALATAMSSITFIAAPIIGGAVGGYRGKLRAEGTLEERRRQARYGQKDISAEANNTVAAENLTKRLETILRQIDGAQNEEERNTKLDQLKRRIYYTQDKIEQGLVNFGEKKSTLNNEYNLVNNLNNALITSSSFEETTHKDIDRRLEQFLSYRSEKIDETQREYITKQWKRSVKLGASFALAGYAVRYFGEHFGWWGHHTEQIHQKPSAHIASQVRGAETPYAQNNLPPGGRGVGIAQTQLTGNPKLTIPVTPSAAEFKPEQITFDHGRGGIQGILDLKNQIRHDYSDLSKAPQSVQDFMKETNVAKQAMKLGFFDPNNPSGAESAMIGKGSSLGFDSHGNLSFHDAVTNKDSVLIHGEPDSSGHIPAPEKYHGKMFDSDKSGAGETVAPENTPENIAPPIEPSESIRAPSTNSEDFNSLATDKLPTAPSTEELREKIQAQIDMAHQTEIPDRQFSGFSKPGHIDIHEMAEKPTLNTDNITSMIPKTHPDFTQNPFHLSAEKLVEIYNIHQQNLAHFFPGKTINNWNFMRGVKAETILRNGGAISNDSGGMGSAYAYMQKLSELTKLKPKTGWLFGRAETVEHYIARALQKAAKDRVLDQLKF